MANFALTTYYIDGEKKDFDDIFSRLRSLILRQEKGTTSMALAYVLDELNCDNTETDNRSSFTFLEAERGRYLSFQTETPFTRDENLEKVLKDKFPGLEIYFEEDATDSAGVLRTNDKDEKYFKGNNYYIDDSENGSEHFDTAEELIEHFKKTYDVRNVSDITDLKNYIYHFNDVYGHDIVLYKKIVITNDRE